MRLRPMIECDASVATRNGASIGLFLKYRRTRNAPSILIVFWLASTILHLGGGRCARTMPVDLMRLKSCGVSRLTAAPVSYRAWKTRGFGRAAVLGRVVMGMWTRLVEASLMCTGSTLDTTELMV